MSIFDLMIDCNNDFNHEQNQHTYLTPSTTWNLFWICFIFSSFCFSIKVSILFAVGVVFLGWLAIVVAIGIRFGSSVKMREQLKLQRISNLNLC